MIVIKIQKIEKNIFYKNKYTYFIMDRQRKVPI